MSQRTSIIQKRTSRPNIRSSSSRSRFGTRLPADPPGPRDSVPRMRGQEATSGSNGTSGGRPNNGTSRLLTRLKRGPTASENTFSPAAGHHRPERAAKFHMAQISSLIEPAPTIDDEAQRQKTALLFRGARTALVVHVIHAFLVGLVNGSQGTAPWGVS